MVWRHVIKILIFQGGDDSATLVPQQLVLEVECLTMVLINEDLTPLISSQMNPKTLPSQGLIEVNISSLIVFNGNRTD